MQKGYCRKLDKLQNDFTFPVCCDAGPPSQIRYRLTSEVKRRRIRKGQYLLHLEPPPYLLKRKEQPKISQKTTNCTKDSSYRQNILKFSSGHIFGGHLSIQSYLTSSKYFGLWRPEAAEQRTMIDSISHPPIILPAARHLPAKTNYRAAQPSQVIIATLSCNKVRLTTSPPGNVLKLR